MSAKAAAGSSMGSSTIESRFIIYLIKTGYGYTDTDPNYRLTVVPQPCASRKRSCTHGRWPVALSWSFNQWQWHGGKQELQNSLGRHNQASAGPYSYFWCRSARPLDFPLLLKLPVPADQLPVLLLPSFCSGRPPLMMLRISSPHNCIYK